MPASSYVGLPNKLIKAANGIDYAYRDTDPDTGGVPMVLFAADVEAFTGDRRQGVS